MKNCRKMALLLVLVLLASVILASCAQTPAPTPTLTPTSTATPAQPIKLVYHHSIGSGVWDGVDRWFMEQVEKQFPGRISFEIIFGGPMGNTQDQPLNLRDGVFDLGWTSNAVYAPGLFPALTVTTLPFMPGDLLNYNRAGQELAQHPAIRAEEDAFNMYTIIHTFSEPMSIGSNVPAKNLDELMPLKIRATGGAAEVTAAAGLQGLGIPIPELAQAVQQGIVDAVIIPFPVTAVALGYQDLIDYWVHVDIYRMEYGVSFNKDVWNGLPADIRDYMLSLIPQAAEVAATAWTEDGEDAIATLKASGVEDVFWGQADLDEIAQIGGSPVSEKWIADKTARGIPAQELYDEFNMLLAKYK